MQCPSCATDITENEPKTQLMCGHTFHTLCVIRYIATAGLFHSRCVACEADVVPPEIQEELYDDNTVTVPTTDRIANLYANDATFLQELKAFKPLKSETRQKYSAFTSTLKTMQSAYREEMGMAFEYVKDKYRAKKKEAMAHPDLKAFRVSKAKFQRSYDAFCRKWEVEGYDLRRYLRRNNATLYNHIDIHGMYTSTWRISRKFRPAVF